MKLKRYCFDKTNISRKLCVVLCALFVTMPVMAVTSNNGCENEKNNRIVPMLALCSTHTYNIGNIENSKNASDRQLVRDVIALKSTVMMQQMYKQYEFLEATVSRLKSQLEREILTSRLEAAGASSSSSGSSSGASVAGNYGVAGAENCRSGTTEDVMNCLSRNLERISAAVDNSELGAAKRQIETDIETLKLYDVYSPGQGASNICKTAQEENCKDLKTNRTDMRACIDSMRVCITRNLEQLQRGTNYNTYNPFMR